MEVSKRNSNLTELCDMTGSKPDLQTHVKNLRGLPPKIGELNFTFFDSFDATEKRDKHDEDEERARDNGQLQQDRVHCQVSTTLYQIKKNRAGVFNHPL